MCVTIAIARKVLMRTKPSVCIQLGNKVSDKLKRQTPTKVGNGGVEGPVVGSHKNFC